MDSDHPRRLRLLRFLGENRKALETSPFHVDVYTGLAPVCYDADCYPYGGERAVTDSCSQDFKFTGKERDAETGNDYFGARFYTSSFGRFLTPDPVFITAARLADPQSLNLYAYVRGNPLLMTDPTGLDFYLTCTQKDKGATCQQVQNGSSKVWVQGTTSNGQFTPDRIANDANGNLVDINHDNAAYNGTFDENGVHLSAVNGSTSGNGQFVDNSSQTNLNGSGLFKNIVGEFVSDCGGSCQGRAELRGLKPDALSTMEAALSQRNGFMTALDLLSGAHAAGTQWVDSSGYIHVILNGPGTLNAGITEMHFEGHPMKVDVVQTVLHLVGTIRDAASGRAAAERNRRLP
jgi:RHS repeat-associated protein